jgi:hypothetical protein
MIFWDVTMMMHRCPTPKLDPQKMIALNFSMGLDLG